MNRTARMIVNFMIKQNAISSNPEYVDFYTYGVEITISSILNIVLVVMIGLLIHAFLESLIFLLVFISVRTFIGGYHADSYFRCNLLMCTSFIMIFFLSNILCKMLSLFYVLIAFSLVLSIIIVFCPIENVNKPIPVEKRLGLKIKGIIISTLFLVISVIELKNDLVISSTIMLTLLCIALLIIAAIIKERREQT